MANQTVRSIAARQTTAGVAQEVLQLRLDGAAAANAIAVALGTTYNLTDVLVTGAAAGEFTVEQTDDGAAWYEIATLYLAAAGMGGVELRTGLRIVGSATTSFRMRVTTAGGAAAVTATIRGYSEA